MKVEVKDEKVKVCKLGLCVICGIDQNVYADQSQVESDIFVNYISLQHQRLFGNGPFCMSCKSVSEKVQMLLKSQREVENELVETVTEIKAVFPLRKQPPLKEESLEIKELYTEAEVKLEDEVERTSPQFYRLIVSKNEDQTIHAAVDGDVFLNDTQRTQHCLEGTVRTPQNDALSTRQEFKCSKEGCEREFQTRIGFMQHKKFSHRERISLCCYFCGKKKNNKHRLYMHIMGSHLHEFYYSCKEAGCRYRTPSWNSWIGHLKRMHVEEWRKQKEVNEAQKTKPKHKCTKCAKPFKSIQRLRNHLETHLPSSNRIQYTCNQCEKTFFKQSTLQEHQIAKHEAEGPKFQCSFQGCNSNPFPSNYRLQRHIKASHVEGKTTCEFCSGHFNNETGLKKHLLQSRKCAETSGRALQLLQCPQTGCSKTFTISAKLNRHIKAVHDKAYCRVSHVCKFCRKKFQSQDQLSKHVVGEHKGIVCKKCKNVFSCGSSLARHMRAVHDELMRNVVFNCEHKGCQKSFRSKSDLKRHTRVFHEKKGLPACYFCQRKLSSKGHLHRHMMSLHLDERPFTCSVDGCGFSAVDLRHLTAHVVDTHPSHNPKRKQAD